MAGYLCSVLRFGLIAATAVSALVGVQPAAPAPAPIVLHPGMSKKMGAITVACTAKTLSQSALRIVIRTGYQVTVRGRRIRCTAISVSRPTPIPTPIPTPTPTPPAAQGARANPYPLGTRISNGTWAFTVNSTNFDAWPIVQAANIFNDPPPAGSQDVLVNFTVSYLGAGSSTLTSFVIDLQLVGQSSVAYTSFTNSCGVLPKPREIDYSTLFTGATIQLNLCWQVPSSDVGTIALATDEGVWASIR
jgi:hypothetical protein